MKTFNRTFLFLSLALVLGSCAKSAEETINNEIDLDDIIVAVTDESGMSDRVISEVHGLSFGKYEKILDESVARIGISASRYEQTGQETVAAVYDESILKPESLSKIKINGKESFSPRTKSGDSSIAELFGNMAEFDFSKVTFGEKAPVDELVKEVYVPETMRIAFPQYDSKNHRAPLCYDKDFVIRWNADSKNENGVLVIVRWNGSVLFGEDFASSYVTHTRCFPDNGSAKLDNSMFEGIPDTAYCTLLVLRGDVENIDVDESDYQLFAETHDMLDFVLIKNIQKVRAK